MLKIIKTAALSAFIGLGVFAAAPATAQAGDLYLGIGGGHSRPGVELHFGGGHSYRHWNRRQHYRACTPGRALDKAQHMGIHRAYVRDVGHRFIRVGGHARGHHVVVTFARTPHCPVVRWS